MSTRILKTLTLALVLGGVFAGSAVAMQIAEPSIYSVSSSRPIVSEKTAGLTAAVPAAPVIVSEKLSGLRPVSQIETPLVSEKTFGLGLPSQSPELVASTGSGFDWNDAGIGAGLMFAVLLALSGAALTLRRHGPLAH